MKELFAEIDNTDLAYKYRQLKWKEQYLEIINDFAIQLMKLDSIDQVVWSIAKQVIARMGFEDCVIYLYDKEKKHLIQSAAYGPKNPERWEIKNPILIQLGQGIVGAVAVSGVPEIVNDTRKDPRYVLDDDYRLSEIAVPIYYENELLGVIDSEHSNAHFYTQQHLEILKTVAAISANKIKHALANEELKIYQKGLEQQVNEKTRALQNVLEKVKRSNTDLESFAYAASHDLQEPLRTIISYLQLIDRREKNLSDEAREYLQFAVNGSKRMKFLLEGLLAYSRLSRFGEDEITELDMNDLLVLIKANLHTIIHENKAIIEVASLHKFQGNKVQVIQLFQNILSNAIKFCSPERTPYITVNSFEEEHLVVFEIKDNGIGIDPDFHAKIFDLFSRLNPVDSFKGSGIGLALCKRIVEYHKGTIEVFSELDEGTTFRLSFPKIKKISR